MPLSRLESARVILRYARNATDVLGLSYSAGKDSCVLLDLAADFGFHRIEAFHLYKVPDLRIVRQMVLCAERRYGIRIRLYPWLTLSHMFRDAQMMPHYAALANIPVVGMKDIEARFRAEAGVSWIAVGWRASDSMSRALILRANGGIDVAKRRIFPLHRWSRREILVYLKIRRIELPESFGRREQGGLDLHPAAMKHLRRYYPEDYEAFKEVFPYVEIYEHAEEAGEGPADIGGDGPQERNSAASQKSQDDGCCFPKNPGAKPRQARMP